MCSMFVVSVIIINVELPIIEMMIYEQAGLVIYANFDILQNVLLNS